VGKESQLVESECIVKKDGSLDESFEKAWLLLTGQI
jgi:hypothetical protein